MVRQHSLSQLLTACAAWVVPCNAVVPTEHFLQQLQSHFLSLCQTGLKNMQIRIGVGISDKSRIAASIVLTRALSLSDSAKLTAGQTI